MKVLIFDIKGRFAHFRKFYTNSSSLSYGIPPRTTLIGLIASILGYERDEYYDIFDSEKMYITSKKLNSGSKILQSLNYIRAVNMREIMVPKTHTQVPFEILTGDNGVCFRVYLSYKNQDLFDQIEKRIIEGRFAYPPSLGTVNFNGSISYVGTVEAKFIRTDGYLSICTPIRLEHIKEMDINMYTGKVIKERMVVDFDSTRRAKKVASYIYDDDGKSISAVVKDGVFQLSNGDNIVFM